MHLPQCVRVLAAVHPTSLQFHVRKSALARTYEYHLPWWTLDPQVTLSLLPHHIHF